MQYFHKSYLTSETYERIVTCNDGLKLNRKMDTIIVSSIAIDVAYTWFPFMQQYHSFTYMQAGKVILKKQ